MMKKYYLYLMFACVAIAGLGGGLLVGGRALTGFMTGSSRAMVLLYRPSFEHVNNATMLNSPDGLKRLAGYYALLQNNTIDPDYLLERCRDEPLPVNKKAIIWILGFSRDKDRARSALEALYDGAPDEFRHRILDSMARLDADGLQDFLRARHPGDAPGAYAALESIYDNAALPVQGKIACCVKNIAPGMLETFMRAHGIEQVPQCDR
jgi:hypothetical protein